MGKLLGGLLAGIVLGLLIGLLVLDGGVTDPIDATDNLAAAREPVPAEDRPLAVPERRASVPGNPLRPSGAVPDGAYDSVKQLLEEQPEVVAATGSGVIDGTVTDAADRPIAGVTVRASRVDERALKRSTRGDGVPVAKTLEEKVRQTVENHYKARAARFEALTDANGRFQLQQLPDSRFSLSAWAEGYELTARGGGARRVEAGSTVDFLATPVLDVAVRIALPDGRDAERAALRIDWQEGRRSRSNSELWRRDRPLLRLTPGRYELTAFVNRSQARELGLAGELTSDSQKITVVAGESQPRLTFELRGQSGIRGKIRIPDQMKVEHLLVRLLQVPAGQQPNLELLKESDTTTWVSPADREYTFLDLASGTYAVGVSLDYSGPVAQHAVVEVTDHIVHQDLEVSDINEQSALLVRLLDHQGKGVAGASFGIRVKTGNGTNSSSTRGVEKSVGEYWILPDADLERALGQIGTSGTRVSLTASSPNHGDKEVDLEAGQRRVTIRLGEIATLDVTVAGFVGSGLEGRLGLSLSRTGDDGSGRFFARRGNKGLGADGKQTLGPVEAGDHQLMMSLDIPGSYAALPLHSRTVSLGPGDNVAIIAIPPLYPLTIRVPGSESGRMQIETPGGGSVHFELKNEMVVLDRIPAGDYVIQLWSGSAPGRMTVNVPARSDVTFEPDPVNAALIEIKDPDGWLARNGFRNGDLIVAFEGKTFSSAVEMGAAFMAIATREDATVTVVRAGKEIQMTFNAQEMISKGDVGGQMQPASR